MQVALLTTFAVTKKEPLSVLLERIHAAFVASGLGEPSVSAEARKAADADHTVEEPGKFAAGVDPNLSLRRRKSPPRHSR